MPRPFSKVGGRPLFVANNSRPWEDRYPGNLDCLRRLTGRAPANGEALRPKGQMAKGYATLRGAHAAWPAPADQLIRSTSFTPPTRLGSRT
jgi:hypothetical protein